MTDSQQSARPYCKMPPMPEPLKIEILAAKFRNVLLGGTLTPKLVDRRDRERVVLGDRLVKATCCTHSAHDSKCSSIGIAPDSSTIIWR